MYVDDDRKVQVLLAIHAKKLRAEIAPRPGAYLISVDRDGNVTLDASFVYYTEQESNPAAACMREVVDPHYHIVYHLVFRRRTRSGRLDRR